MNEAEVQLAVRLAAAREHVWLLRNNSGALPDRGGRLVRFGLGNESAAVNDKLKSSDLIGIRPVTITSDMVGAVIGQFIAIETKTPAFRGPAGSKRATAQAAWMGLVRDWGGRADFGPTLPEAQKIWRDE